jgi:predicted metal-dependent phosphoesterase TrpH
MIDLHTHSTFSDGSLTPEQLAERAGSMGLTAIALTDHDCTGGVEQFLAACKIRNIRGVPGVEISADVKHGTMHLLGYFIASGDAALESMLHQIRDGREIRNREILRKLNALGLDLTWPEVASLAGEDVVGRPHFAQALLARGYVSSREAAFDLYLAKGKPAYADRFRLSPADSIAAIRGAGGIAVLAHPFTLDLAPGALKTYITELRDKGLQGIEVYYSEHSADLTRSYLTLVRELGLAATGGSDFHGESNPAIKLGRGFGTLSVPDSVMEELNRVQSEGR